MSDRIIKHVIPVMVILSVMSGCTMSSHRLAAAESEKASAAGTMFIQTKSRPQKYAEKEVRPGYMASAADNTEDEASTDEDKGENASGEIRRSSETVLEAVREIVPEATSETVRGATPEIGPGTTPETVSEAASKIVPEAASETVPGAASEIEPETAAAVKSETGEESLAAAKEHDELLAEYFDGLSEAELRFWFWQGYLDKRAALGLAAVEEDVTLSRQCQEQAERCVAAGQIMHSSGFGVFYDFVQYESIGIADAAYLPDETAAIPDSFTFEGNAYHFGGEGGYIHNPAFYKAETAAVGFGIAKDYAHRQFVIVVQGYDKDWN